MDDELVARAARGDADAFDALARDRIDRLFAIAFRILRDHHDAEDAVQHALWTAWSDLPGLRDPAPVRCLAVSVAHPRLLSGGSFPPTARGHRQHRPGDG